VETEARATSLTISAAVAMSSAPPGGGTEPLALAPSLSKPCRGTGSAFDGAAGARRGRCRLAFAGAVRFGAGRRALEAAVEPLDGFAARRSPLPAFPRGAALRRVGFSPGAPLSLRAAARRALARCGRVRGRFARTLGPASVSAAVSPLSAAELTGTSLLNRSPQVHGQHGPAGAARRRPSQKWPASVKGAPMRSDIDCDALA
jgi:hypothetical protein